MIVQTAVGEITIRKAIEQLILVYHLMMVTLQKAQQMKNQSMGILD